MKPDQVHQLTVTLQPTDAPGHSLLTISLVDLKGRCTARKTLIDPPSTTQLIRDTLKVMSGMPPAPPPPFQN